MATDIDDDDNVDDTDIGQKLRYCVVKKTHELKWLLVLLIFH